MKQIAFRFISIIILSLLLSGPEVHADEKFQPNWALESRYRLELRNNFNLNHQTYEDDALNLIRNRLGFNLKILEPTLPQLDLFVQGQEAHDFAKSQIHKTSTFVNEFDLRQLSADIKSGIDFLPGGIKVGRQELAYGDERLVGSSNWTNTARVFDTVKFYYVPQEKFRLDVFFSRPVRVETEKADKPIHSDNFYGIYGTLKPSLNHTIDTFLFIRHNRDKSLIGEKLGQIGPLKEYTFGNRLKGKHSNWDYGTEYALQFGSKAHDSIEAWAFHQDLGYTFSKLFGVPHALLEFNHASGDRNPTDGVFSTFDNLFPTNHDKYGFIDLMSLKNMNNIRTGVSIKPHSRISVSSDFHWFFLDAKESAWFNATGTVVRPTNPNASCQLGEELDLLATVKLTEYLNFLTGYSHFFAGPFAKDTGTADDADFFYAQLSLKV